MCIQLIDETIFEDFPLKYLNIFSIFYSRKKGQKYTHNTRFAMHKIEIINNYGSGALERMKSTRKLLNTKRITVINDAVKSICILFILFSVRVDRLP